MEAALRQFLLTLPAVQAAVGNRLYPNAAAQQAPLPRIVYQVVGGENIVTQGGTNRLVSDVVQMNCWAEKYSDAAALAEALNAAVDSFAGVIAGVEIRKAFTARPRALQDDPLPGAERGPAAKSVAWTVWHVTPAS